jgi:hypothetical protein
VPKSKAVDAALRYAAAVWSWAGRIDDAWRRFRLLLILVGLAIASAGWILSRGPIVVAYLGVGLLLAGLAMGLVGGLLWIRSMLLSPAQRRKGQTSGSLGMNTRRNAQGRIRTNRQVRQPRPEDA